MGIILIPHSFILINLRLELDRATTVQHLQEFEGAEMLTKTITQDAEKTIPLFVYRIIQHVLLCSFNIVFNVYNV